MEVQSRQDLYNIIKWFVGQFDVKFEKKPEREARWFFREFHIELPYKPFNNIYNYMIFIFWYVINTKINYSDVHVYTEQQIPW